MLHRVNAIIDFDENLPFFSGRSESVILGSGRNAMPE